MASTTKRAWKLQEFVAHSANVNCLALSHKSGRVMVTGGEDKKVNMWAVGKPSCIMSLSGHASPVESVRFGNAEEMVVAGSMSGALKIWDLEAAKILRTLAGHKSSIKSLDFHPYGDFVASGSMDTNIKLWDIRRKGCIFTYKGHTKCVNSLRFSPDGRWIASAGEDGLLKLWDLTAGKLLTDFTQHTGPVTSVEFHPTEFLIASGSADRTVKFWDLESFNLVSTTDGDCTPIRSIFFHPEGLALYSAATDMLKVYGWEPARCFDSLSLGWGKVADIALTQNQLIGATFSQNFVSTYVVDVQCDIDLHEELSMSSGYSAFRGLDLCTDKYHFQWVRVQPLGGPPSQPTSPPMTSSGRRSFIERPHTQSSRQVSQPKEEPGEDGVSAGGDEGGADDDNSSPAEIQDPQNYQEVFRSRTKISRSPSRSKPVEPFPAPLDDVATSRNADPAPTPVSKPSVAPQSTSSTSTTTGPTAPSLPTAVTKPTTGQSQPAKKQNSQSQQTRPAAVHSPAERDSAPSGVKKVEANSAAPGSHLGAGDINMEDFLPKQPVHPSVRRDISHTDAISTLANGHDSMLAVLTCRSKNLQIVRALWTGGKVKTAVDSAISMRDQAVMVDVINVMLQKTGLWSLELCATLLPELASLLESKYECYVTTGVTSIKLVLRNFASVIKSNITAPPSVGVDITREERYQKCKQCYRELMKIRSILDQKQNTPGAAGGRLRELQLLMNQLE